MPSRLEHTAKLGLHKPPSWMTSGAIVREVIMGSSAYGCSNDDSDLDVYGIAIPPKGYVFPHTEGYLVGFDKNIPVFNNYQEHHVKDASAKAGRGIEYDFNITGIVEFFKLAADNNPNIIDSLFVGQNCVLHQTTVGSIIAESRHDFLHKGLWHRFKGYSYSQLHKLEIKNPGDGTRRAGYVEQFGYDVKFAYHIVRLLSEAEQALTTGTINLTQDAETYKAIRNGEWTLDQIKAYFTLKEIELEAAYVSSSLQRKPDMNKLKQILLNCLEHHYGSLAATFNDPAQERKLLAEIKTLCERAGV